MSDLLPDIPLSHLLDFLAGESDPLTVGKIEKAMKKYGYGYVSKELPEKTVKTPGPKLTDAWNKLNLAADEILEILQTKYFPGTSVEVTVHRPTKFYNKSPHVNLWVHVQIQEDPPGSFGDSFPIIKK